MDHGDVNKKIDGYVATRDGGRIEEQELTVQRTRSKSIIASANNMAQPRPCSFDEEYEPRGKIPDQYLYLIYRSFPWALFTSTLKSNFFQDSPSYRIFRRMHEVLNIDENIKTNCTVWSKFTRRIF